MRIKYNIMIIIDFLIFIISVGISDALELLLNPMVHKLHNAPDIRKKCFAKYTTFDAFLTGVICCKPLLFLIPIFLFFNITFVLVIPVSIYIILIPIISYVTGFQEEDYFWAHIVMYITTIMYFGMLLLLKITIPIYLVAEKFFVNHDIINKFIKILIR